MLLNWSNAPPTSARLPGVVLVGTPSSTQQRTITEHRLAGVLPLTGDDSHVLLADIPGTGPLDGRIGDMGHLEFWIRAGDLAAHDFTQAWALLR